MKRDLQMAERSTYERFLRTTFPTLFASVVDLLGDEEEAAIVAQRLILRAYCDEPDATFAEVA